MTYDVNSLPRKSGSTSAAHGTFVRLLRDHAESRPGDTACTFLDSDGSEARSYTYGALHHQARAIAAELLGRGAAGERVLLLYPPSLEFVPAFFGCLYAGAIAVPLPAPQPRSVRAHARVMAAARDAGAKFVMSSARALGKIRERVIDGEWAATQWIASDSVDVSDGFRWTEAEVEPDAIALLQYTSGSTSAPRGVMVTHRNLIHNQELISAATSVPRGATLASWLPTFHDMGLGFVLHSVFVGGRALFLSPATFLQQPVSWLQAISRYRAYASGGPSFGFELCARAVREEEKEGLDLSSWKVALNGSEPVRPETLDRFVRAFGPVGFDARSFVPSYGLAEATLLVTGRRTSERPKTFYADKQALSRGRIVASPAGDARGQHLVACGTTTPGVTLRIVDPATRTPVGEGEIGEIWTRSDSVAAGYWNRPAESEEVFAARTVDGEGPFLRTGDLGVLHEGELIVTGRIKDLIIVRGQNYYPHDIERTVEGAHEAVRSSCVAAFPADVEGEEKLVVALELDPRKWSRQRDLSMEDIAAAIRLAISQNHELDVHGVLFLEAGTLPKTSSGKIQRRLCRQAFEARELRIVGQSLLAAPSVSDEFNAAGLIALAEPERRQRVAEWLIATLSRLAGSDPSHVRADGAVLQFGADSLRMFEWGSLIESHFGTRLSLESIANGSTFLDLAGQILQTVNTVADERFAPLIEDSKSRHEPFPLTDIQQAYVAGQSGAYELGGVGCHVYFEFKIDHLDPQRLEQSWQQLVLRHDMLRAVVTADKTRQQILAEVPRYAFAIVDGRGNDAADSRRLLEEVRGELSDRIFDPTKWPLFDIRITKLPAGTRLHFAIDLLIADASSLFLLFSEWKNLYQSAGDLPSIDVTYRDYVIAERKLRATPRYERSLRYWRERAGTLPPPPELPLAKDPSKVSPPRFARRTRILDRRTWAALSSVASSCGVTPSVLLLTAYAEALARWSKRQQFTLNLTMSNRLALHPRIGQVVGDFTSVVLVPFDHSAGGDFRARAAALQKQLWMNLEHRHVSGLELLRQSAVRNERASTSMPVVFTSTLDMRDGHADDSASWLGKPEFGVSRTPQVWLDHSVSEHGGELILNWDAVEELFPPAMLDDFVSANLSLLERLAGDPDAATGASIEMLPQQQLARRAAANQTSAEFPAETLASLFERTAARQVSASGAAIVAGARRVSFAELSNRSARLAAELRRRGAKPNSLVAIVMESGWEQIVAALSIARSGAAYVPIDASLPQERMLRLLAHSGASMALTQRHIDDSVQWPASVQRLVIGDHDDLAATPAIHLRADNPSDVAYVIYTSGSTGEPKGVVIDHRGAVNTILDINARFGVSSADKILALSSLSFDLSVYDIFGMLAAGGTTVSAGGELRDPGLWAELIERERISIWNSVPALMEMLVDSAAARKRDLTSLRLVMMSGDWIPVTLPDRIREIAPNAEIISLGGATEASIWSICYRIDRVDGTWKSIPYGKPLANQTFQILNSSFENSPDWVVGNLYIGGTGLARGYWRDEEKTNRRFIAHPKTGERLYDTGDVGRYLPDGNIEFLGREDLQTKIQGFRVELSEIEAVLMQHEAVKIAVVLAVGEKQGHKRLVGYVVPKDGIAPSRTPDVLPAGVGAMADGLLMMSRDARDQFKHDQRGLRTDLEGATCVPLAVRNDEEEVASFRARKSAHRFEREQMPVEKLAAFLSPLRQLPLDGNLKRRYPSAGGLYPVQVYLHLKDGAVDGLTEGLYYYHPAAHQLRLLSTAAAITRELHVPHNRATFDSATFSIFLIGDLDAIRPMYGNLGRDFSLLEAGYMSQLLMESAGRNGIGLCPIGTLAFGSIEHLFQLNGHHLLLHGFVGGPASADDDAIGETVPRLAVSDSVEVEAGLVTSLRDVAAQKLPRYMVPSSFVVVDALPLSRNGKVDRGALAAEKKGARDENKVAADPSISLEAAFLKIVKDVLQLEEVERERNLFDVGANSIHLVQIHGKIQDYIGREFSVVDMFQYPSVAALARHLRDQIAGSESEPSQSRANIRRETMARRAAARGSAGPSREPVDG